MLHLLESGLHNRNGIVRKGCALVLKAPKKTALLGLRREELLATPPVLCNSIPKSGTHLLDQIVQALPGRRNYGEFLSSMTSSFQFRRRTTQECCRILGSSLPGEIVRAHLFYEDDLLQVLKDAAFVHYFIYRDPRDVVVSEAHYCRSINHWHRLHPLFRDAPTISDAIMLAIEGVADPSGRLYFPDIGRRFMHYEPWINAPNVCSVSFEDLISDERTQEIRRMVEFYAKRAGATVDADQLVESAIQQMAPEKSHTFRSGRQGGWREAFTDVHRETFKRVAGDVLIRYGYETNSDW